MRWAEIGVGTTSEAQDAVSNILMESGCRGVVLQGEAPVVITCYLPVDDRLEQTLMGIRAKLDSLPEFGIDAGGSEVSVRYAEDDDWAEAWKQFFHAERISKRIVVKPTWEGFARERGDVVIELDPGMAFGTGNHPTTRLCLQAIEKNLRPGAVVVDFGTGSGILAIAAARLGAKLVIAFDSDALAVQAARANVQHNELEEIIEVHQANSLSFVNTPAHLITANLLAQTVIENAEHISGLLRDGGIIIASGIVAERSSEVQDALSEAGIRISERLEDGEWVALVGRKAQGASGSGQ